MSETRDLIGIYGAVDRAVVQDPRLRGPVSRLLPNYEHSKVHWFGTFEDWTMRMRGEEQAGPPFPGLDDSLRELAQSERAARGRMRARRMFAIAVATRAFPELGPNGDKADLARGALRFEGIRDEDHAHALLEILADETLVPDEPAALRVWWARVREGFESVAGSAAALGPVPCSGRLTMVELPDGSRRPVATLKTWFETAEVSFDDAIRFLEPSNWRRCNDFWCAMDKVEPSPPGVHRYHEVVSTDCDNRDAAWTIEAELDFTFTKLVDTAIAEYQLSPGHPQPGDDVLVDEGALVVREVPGPKLWVTTTKRVLFSETSFTGEALSMLMCALGYASVAEDFVFTCAALEPGGGIELPVEEPGEKGGLPDCGPAIKELADRAAISVKARIDDYADAAQASSKKIADGCYGPDALVQDMTGMWARMLRDSATAVDLGVRSARAAARPRARRPPEL